MLLTIGVVLLILWVLGLVVHMGSLIHVLLVVGLVLLIVHLLRGHSAEV